MVAWQRQKKGITKLHQQKKQVENDREISIEDNLTANMDNSGVFSSTCQIFKYKILNVVSLSDVSIPDASVPWLAMILQPCCPIKGNLSADLGVPTKAEH